MSCARARAEGAERRIPRRTRWVISISAAAAPAADAHARRPCRRRGPSRNACATVGRPPERLEGDVDPAVAELAHRRTGSPADASTTSVAPIASAVSSFSPATSTAITARRAERARQRDDVESDAAGGDDRDAVALGHAAGVGDRPVGREHGAAEHGGALKLDRLGHREDVGGGHDRILGEPGHRVHRERAPVGARQAARPVVERSAQAVHREEALAEVVATAAAMSAVTAGHDERAGNAVARGDPRHARPDLLDDPRDLVAEDAGRRERDLALDHVQVGVADAAAADPHEHLARKRRRARQLLDYKRLARRLEHDRAHRLHDAPASHRLCGLMSVANDLVAAAKDLSALASSSAADAEAQGKLTDELVDAFHETGLWAMWMPASWAAASSSRFPRSRSSSTSPTATPRRAGC